MPEETHERSGNKRNNLKEAIEKLYQEKQFSDVTFTVGRKEFQAHKLILSSRCSEFVRILLDPNAVQHIIIEDEPVTEIGFEILLRFIYTDELGTDDKLSIVQAYLAADHFKLKIMKDKCEKLMNSWSLTVDEVCELLNESLGIPSLKEKCLNFIENNAAEVSSSPNFSKINYAAMVCLLDNDILKSVDLKNRIVNIIEWGRHQKKDTDDLTVVRDYFLNSSPPLLGKLKIEELDIIQFSQLFADEYKMLLTDSEIASFMTYTHRKKKEILPEWCRNS